MMNKRCIVWMAFLWASMGALAQSTARQFEVKVSNDGEATLTCFLPAADKARVVPWWCVRVVPIGRLPCSMRHRLGRVLQCTGYSLLRTQV